jgi:hypothetical protein
MHHIHMALNESQNVVTHAHDGIKTQIMRGVCFKVGILACNPHKQSVIAHSSAHTQAAQKVTLCNPHNYHDISLCTL